MWTHHLQEAREVASRLARAEHAGGLLLAPDVPAPAPGRAVSRPRTVDAILDAARGGRFGPVLFDASYRLEMEAHLGGVRTTLSISATASGAGVGLAVGTLPARFSAARQAAGEAPLQALGLTTTWTRAPGGVSCWLSGGLEPLGVGRPRTSVDAIVRTAAAVIDAHELGAVAAWHPLTAHSADVAACNEALPERTILGSRRARLAGRDDGLQALRSRSWLLRARGGPPC